MTKLLIAASGTGGHLFPALGVAQQLQDFEIEWLGVPDRLEQTLVPKDYLLHSIPVTGFQKPLGINTLKVAQGLITAILKVQNLLKERQIDVVFSTGGYIASPAIIAAKWQKIPVILHESNYIPGKVTRFLGSWCSDIALGFADTAQYLPKVRTTWVSTPVRDQFLTPQPLDLPIPSGKPLIVVIGGSQGALAVNQLVRECVYPLTSTGAFLVHLTGDNDPDINSVQHPQYIPLPFYHNMAGLLQRATLAISRAGAGTLTELAVTHTPAILIPYPYAAEDHQTYNAQVFARKKAALVYSQKELTPRLLQEKVKELLSDAALLQQMAANSSQLAVIDSAAQLADLIRARISANS